MSKSNEEVEIIEEDQDEITVICLKNGRKQKKLTHQPACTGSNKDGTSLTKMEKDEESMQVETFRRMATQALVREAKQSAQRAQTFGPQGW